MTSIGRSIKSLFLVEFVSAFFLSMRYFLRRRRHSTIRLRRGRCRLAFAASTPSGATRTGRSAASPASCARRSARRWRSRLKPARVATTNAARRPRLGADVFYPIPGGIDRRVVRTRVMAQILLLADNPHGGEELKDLLAGQILWVSTDQLVRAAVSSPRCSWSCGFAGASASARSASTCCSR